MAVINKIDIIMKIIKFINKKPEYIKPLMIDKMI